MTFDPEDLILDIMQNMMAGTSSKEGQNSNAAALSIGLSKGDNIPALKTNNDESADNAGNNASAGSAGFDQSVGKLPGPLIENFLHIYQHFFYLM